MIVLDASTLVSATFNDHGVPARAVEHALQRDRLAISDMVLNELRDVLNRPGVSRFIRPERRSQLLHQLVTLGIPFTPTTRVTDCRDPKDNKYLELALASGAGTIVSSDQDLLVLHPWRGIRIFWPAHYLTEAGPGA